ncbi:MAG TPA: hypothetical protein V6C84_21755 [Coleofasciculaceae cyanobacterium]|jgi:hypothetical protein
MAEAIDEMKYILQQQQFWEQLRQELERYKNDLGATHTELAQCLGISRQPLVMFMQDSSQGLPIQRSNLIRLWDLLTEPTRFRKKFSEEARSNRATLRQQGANTLLKAAGFLPDATEQALEVRSNRHQQIQRLASRLSNLPVADFADFITLTDFLETFITHSFPGRYKPALEEIQTRDPHAAGHATDLVDAWIEKNHLPNAPDPVVKAKLQGALSRLAISGKSKLNNAEFFELYMSIAENERQINHIDKFLKIRITQCQFTTLTFSLPQHLSPEERQFIESDIYEASLAVEKSLRPQIHERRDLEDSVAEPVIETLITCNFREAKHDVRWRYSSSTTHFENMLAAIGRGLGYDADLEMADFSIRTLGHKDYSLIRASTALRPIHSPDPSNYKSYQSVWIDRSAILSILQSIVITAKSWLAENFPDEESCQGYYEVCQIAASINDHLIKGRVFLNSYRIHQTDYSDGLSTKDYLEKEVIEKVKNLKQGLFKQYPKLRDCFEADLTHKYYIAQLACAHSALLEGNMITASNLLMEVEAFLKDLGNEMHPLRISYLIEINFQRYLQGAPEIFLKRDKWRFELREALTQLRIYIDDCKQDCGRFAADIYINASELYGRLARLNFCCCDRDDIDELEAAVNYFLMAAHCSAKTGHRHRTAHWINNASRTCVRLGEGDRAKSFADLAERIINRASESTYSPEYQEAIIAEVNIARGERLLLIEKDPTGALDYFLRSLKGSIYIGFVRLMADNLYDIARASKDLGNYRIKKSFASAFGKNELKTNWILNEETQSWQENKIAAEVIQFINAIDKDNDWSFVSAQFKEQAQKIWRSLASFSDIGHSVSQSASHSAAHPIEALMETEEFLNRVR